MYIYTVPHEGRRALEGKLGEQSASFEQHMNRIKGEISISECSIGDQPSRRRLLFERPALCFYVAWPSPTAPTPSTSCSALLGIST